MAKLPKYTLTYNDKKSAWDLKQDVTKIVVKTFDTKDEATKGGVLKKTVGGNGGSVKIQLKSGDFQEERTYPKSSDPKGSKG